MDEFIIHFNENADPGFTGTVTFDDFRRRESVPDDA
jgi:hypothetical protein